jgi:hypothetical protein
MRKIKSERHKEIKERLQDKHSDRVKTSLYLSETLLKGFKKACGTATPSRILEELMSEFIENTK